MPSMSLCQATDMQLSSHGDGKEDDKAEISFMTVCPGSQIPAPGHWAPINDLAKALMGPHSGLTRDDGRTADFCM